MRITIQVKANAIFKTKDGLTAYEYSADVAESPVGRPPLVLNRVALVEGVNFCLKPDKGENPSPHHPSRHIVTRRYEYAAHESMPGDMPVYKEV